MGPFRESGTDIIIKSKRVRGALVPVPQSPLIPCPCKTQRYLGIIARAKHRAQRNNIEPVGCVTECMISCRNPGKCLRIPHLEPDETAACLNSICESGMKGITDIDRAREKHFWRKVVVSFLRAYSLCDQNE